MTVVPLESVMGGGIVTKSSQRDQRISMTADDQFGRPWAMEVEKETQEPTCIPMPAGWRDFLRTPPQFVKIPRGKHGQRKLGDVVVDFASWIDAQRENERAWTDFIWTRAEVRFANNLPKPEELETHPLLVKDAGPKPWPSADVLIYLSENPEAPLAREILGFGTMEARSAEQPDPELSTEAQVLLGVAKPKDLLAAMEEAPKRYQEFLAWAIAKGKAKNMTAAAKLWTEEKAKKAS